MGWVVRYLCNLPEFGEVKIGEPLAIRSWTESQSNYLQLATVDNIAGWIIAIARRVRAHRRRIVQEVTESLRRTDRSPEERHPDDAAVLSCLQRILPEIQQFQDAEMTGVNSCCFASGCAHSRDENGLDLMICSVCRGVQYCSKKCQKV